MKNVLIHFLLLASIVIATGCAQADQKDPRLPSLFTNLLSVSPGARSIILERKIWDIWLESENKTITHLMESGEQATQAGNISDALDAYTQVIMQNPNYAEGWNKRALTHYLMGHYEASLSDIRKTLTLEPRHFGALSGQGLIYLVQNKWSFAKRAFKKVLEIHPTMRGPRANLLLIEKLGIEEEI
ncbi:MAG: hypothetical protein V7776_15635 [Halopseudomonas aestusnigri]